MAAPETASSDNGGCSNSMSSIQLHEEYLGTRQAVDICYLGAS
jgi:hypothetical protein